ncbi:hypothetical protein BPOR_0027g00280 [Botrytis porri]|uniref:Uncharacterized protein n=1 Tax=Botrytis porri TaxID=87229 RepID=A0A4Z1L3U2_9HELO|nr:hypothetical protein BPOR_0027g00280 [Botrytis porri]
MTHTALKPGHDERARIVISQVSTHLLSEHDYGACVGLELSTAQVWNGNAYTDESNTGSSLYCETK